MADKKCRLVRPTALDYLDRAVILSKLGFSASSETDITAAETVKADELALLRWSLRHHSEPGMRLRAGRALLLLDQASVADTDDALDVLFASGEMVIHRVARRGVNLEGWVASLVDGSKAIECTFGDGRKLTLALEREVSTGAEQVVRAPFSLAADQALSVSVRGRVGSAKSEPTIVYPECVSPTCFPGVIGPTAKLSVIVPIFADPESLGACLRALVAQQDTDIAFIVVDDASPHPEVTELGRRFCQGVSGHYHRSFLNGGFASAINIGLSFCKSGDVLLLNSDVTLPPGALDRLRAAARGTSDIGTVTPLSNDSGVVGFPDPLRPNPALGTAESIDIDRAAQAANPNQVVDILAALGSCLYVTRSALSRVGELSLHYGRGYYEDVDFYLRVRQAGLRNVAACDVYVSHKGGRSFGSEKRALVARNHSIFQRRFPNYELEDVVFDFADPLRKVRAAIEERLRPDLDHAVIIVGRAAGSEALFDQRIKVWGESERRVLLIRWRGLQDHVGLELTVSQGSGPRSLHFELTRDNKRILNYLAALNGVEIEILEHETVPFALVGLLDQIQRPMSLVIDSLASTATIVTAAINPLDNARSSGLGRWPARCRIVPLDRMAASWLEPARGSQPLRVTRPRHIGRDIGRLGVSLPTSCPEAERLILSLARIFRRKQPTTVFVVFGRAIDEKQLMSAGNVWVTGPLLGDDTAIIAEQYGIDAFLSAYRAAMFWHVESLGNRLGVPIAYFDWSADRSSNAPADLALDYGLNNADACKMILAWFDVERSSICIAS